MSFLISCFACVVMSQAAAMPSWSSPLADYRSFDAEPPPKPWRAANDEVREAGGHVGLMKSAVAPGTSMKGAPQPPAGSAAKGPPAPAAKPSPLPPSDAPAAAPKGRHDHGGPK